MRTSIPWDGAVSDDNVKVTVNGVRRAVKSVRVQSGMKDGHPASDTSSWCTEATIEWATPDEVTAGSPEPFSGDSWLPKVGDVVSIETGEGTHFFGAGEWFLQHRGQIDSTTGSIADGTAKSQTVDNIEDLGNRAEMGALLSTMTPWADSGTYGEYRRMGLQSAFFVDRFFRNAQNQTTGWYATPPETWETVGSATGIGSLWAEQGTLLRANKWGDTTTGPAWISTDYGVAPFGFEAEYAFTATADRSDIVVSFAVPRDRVTLPDGMAGDWVMNVHDGEGNGVMVAYRRSADIIEYGSTTGAAMSGPTWSVPATYNGRRAERAALRFTRNTMSSQTLTLRVDDGREETRDPGAANYPTGWAATRAYVRASGPGGWWMVEGKKPDTNRWATLNHTPTARIRQQSPTWWSASRDLPWYEPAKFLEEQLTAECAACWLDEDGRMQWAGRGVLDAQSRVQTVTTALQVDEIEWESRRQSLARGVWINYIEPGIRRLKDGPRQNCWESGSSDLARGEEETITVKIPEDEDWISVDMASSLLSSSTSPAQLRVGSKHGGASYKDTDNEPDQAWAIGLSYGLVRQGLRTFVATVAAWSSNPVGVRIKTVIPETADKLAAWHHGHPALRIRSRALITWVEGVRSIVAGSIGPARFTHDVGWRVQTVGAVGGDGDGIGDLLSWLKGVCSSVNPTVTGLTLEHDPRRQVGDKIRVEDPYVTGVWFDVLIQEREIDVGAFTDTIKSGRITAWGELEGLDLAEPSEATAMTPPTNWNREKG